MHPRTMRPAISEATLARLDLALASTAPAEESPARRPAPTPTTTTTTPTRSGRAGGLARLVERFWHRLGVAVETQPAK